MPVFPLAQFPDSQGRFEIPPDQARHLMKVLRARPGQAFEVSLPDGRRGRARLVQAGDSIGGIWLAEEESPPLASLPAWLGIGIVKMSRLEWLVEKATELGLERMSLLQLSQGNYPKFVAISSNKIDRLNKISQETLKQCERNTFMRIEEPQSLESYCAQVKSEAPESLRVLLKERSKSPLLPRLLEQKSGLRVFLVGPEGGFSEKECAVAAEAGFEAASLGSAILRSETAALAALSLVQLEQAAKEVDR